MRTAINAVAPAAAGDRLDDLAQALFDTGCVRFGDYTLKSGRSSPFYLDLRRLTARPEVLRLVARELSRLLATLTFDHVAALPYAALPIGTAISLQTGASLVYPRREVKEYGTKAAVEGVFAQGDTAVVVDDLATSGSSKIEAIERLNAAGLAVTDIAVLVDRQGGAAELLGEAGYRLHSVITVRDLVDRLERLGAIDTAEHHAVVAYLDG
jgi:uridine monophosphate synthetase